MTGRCALFNVKLHFDIIMLVAFRDGANMAPFFFLGTEGLLESFIRPSQVEVGDASARSLKSKYYVPLKKQSPEKTTFFIFLLPLGVDH